MPKLWTDTVAAHRLAVRDAILNAAAELVAQRGPASVTMSQIAAEAGIGRATLYKYFADVDAILVAWHGRHVAAHLAELTAIVAGPADAGTRLVKALQAYAEITFHRGRHSADLAAVVHRDEHVAEAEQQLVDLFRGLLAEAAAAGDVRGDVDPAELAGYCLHAVAAAAEQPSPAARRRLVKVILDGLRSR
ncbi:TetR/AcrR family transcriptional regulator [Amycolatopsis sp. NPDC005003]